MIESELKLTAHCIETLQAALNSSIVSKYNVDSSISDPVVYSGIYYDTIKGHLGDQGVSFRVRQENDKWVAALKMAGQIVNGLSQRVEFEAECDGWVSRAQELPDSIVKDKLGDLIGVTDLLLPRVKVHTLRTIVNLEIPQSDSSATQIELVADNCDISGVNNSTKLYEIELELKQGDIEVVRQIGQQLLQAYELTPSITTKHAIGASLG